MSPIRIKNEAATPDYPMTVTPGQQIQPRNRVVKIPIMRRNESKPLTNTNVLASNNSYATLRVPYPPNMHTQTQKTIRRVDSAFS